MKEELLIFVTCRFQYVEVDRLLICSSSGGRVALAMHRCHKPTIVALNGSAVGVGMTMTLPAAIR
jgi:enoyl-CoA hydratase/carnithine racemase